MRFGEKLKTLRCKEGMTQEELAKRLFVSRSAVSKWETDAGYPSIDTLKQISGLFQMSVDELISDGEMDHVRSGKRLYACVVVTIALTALFAVLLGLTGQKIYLYLSIAAAVSYVILALWYKERLANGRRGKFVLQYILSRAVIAVILLSVILTTIL